MVKPEITSQSNKTASVHKALSSAVEIDVIRELEADIWAGVTQRFPDLSIDAQSRIVDFMRWERGSEMIDQVTARVVDFLLEK